MEKEIRIGHTTHTHTIAETIFPLAAAHSFDDDVFFFFCFAVAIELQSFFFCCVSEIRVKVPSIVSGRYLLFVYDRCCHLYFHWLQMNLLAALLRVNTSASALKTNSKRFFFVCVFNGPTPPFYRFESHHIYFVSAIVSSRLESFTKKNAFAMNFVDFFSHFVKKITCAYFACHNDWQTVDSMKMAEHVLQTYSEICW